MLEKSARTGDLLLDDAVSTLHRSGYNIVESINTMQVHKLKFKCINYKQIILGNR
jgi:hypothetical protein